MHCEPTKSVFSSSILSISAWRPFRALSVTLLAALPLAASAQAPDTLGDTDDWLGTDLGVEQVRLQAAGDAYFVQVNASTFTAETGPTYEPPTTVLPHEPQPEGALVWHGVDVRKRQAYTAKVPREDLEFVGAYARRLGLDGGKVGRNESIDPRLEPREEPRDDPRGSTTFGGLASKGWSDDLDSRIRLNSTTSYPYRTIGTLYDGGGDCTGTLVGPRHVLTAAHCIYNRSSESWSFINFKPGRNGDGSAPYGAFSPIWYWVPQQYIDEPFIGNPADGHANNRWDIAIIVLDDSFWSWMGYASWSGNVLDEKTLFMRGYPRCGTGGAPAGCAPKTLWGDVKRCELGQYFNPDPTGWNYEIKTNCDGSGGHSGSSYYYYTSNAVATIGVFSGQYCDGPCAGNANDDWPNIITRITPTYLNVISWFRAAYP